MWIIKYTFEGILVPVYQGPRALTEERKEAEQFSTFTAATDRADYAYDDDTLRVEFIKTGPETRQCPRRVITETERLQSTISRG